MPWISPQNYFTPRRIVPVDTILLFIYLMETMDLHVISSTNSTDGLSVSVVLTMGNTVTDLVPIHFCEK